MRLKHFYKVSLSCLSFLLLVSTAYAQEAVEVSETTGSLFDLPLDKLLDTEVAVASGLKSSLREAPGIVSVITREEIEKSGANDLFEVLLLLPGTHAYQDLTNLVGVGSRGRFGGTGILLLWNGVEMQSLAFGNWTVSGRFPAEQIERVEMLRGSGSVLHGGFAQQGVINVVTRSHDDLSGVHVSGFGGATDETWSRAGGNFMFNQKIDEVSLVGRVFAGQGHRGDGSYSDPTGNSFSLTDENEVKNIMASLDLRVKEFDLKLMAENHDLRTQDGVAPNLPDDIGVSFEQFSVIASYDIKPSESLSIVPKVEYKRAVPNQTTEGPEGVPFQLFYDHNVDVFNASLVSILELSDQVDLLAGAEYEEIEDENVSGIYPIEEPGTEYSYSTRSFFGEVKYESEIANFTVGGRFDNPSGNFADNTFSPRAAITKVFDRLHLKAIATRGFGYPGVTSRSSTEQAANYVDIEPLDAETSQVYEIEAGYKITDDVHLTANIFHAEVKNSLQYNLIPRDDAPGGFVEFYTNSDQRDSTEGFETILRTQKDWGYIDLNYSYYQNDEGPSVGTSDDRYGFARHKVAGRASYEINENLSINPSFVFFGDRYAPAINPLDGSYQPTKIDEVLLAHLHVLYSVPCVDGLKVDFGINNLIGERLDLAVPLEIPRNTMSGFGREYIVKLIYDLN